MGFNSFEGAALNRSRRTEAQLKAALAEPERLSAVRHSELLDSPADEAFDRLTRLTARLLRVPVTVFSIVDADRHFLKSSVGIPEPWASKREIPHDYSFCQHIVARDDRLVMSDAALLDIGRDTPAVGEMGIHAYAGIPIRAQGGAIIGALCAMDSEPRTWSNEELSLLEDLTQAVQAHVDTLARVRLLTERHEAVIQSLSEVVFETGMDGRFTYLNQAWEHITGYTVEESLGVHTGDFLPPADRGLNAQRFAPLFMGEVESVCHEHRYVTKAGGVRWTEVRARRLQHDGQPIGIAGVLTDITERRAAANASERIQNEFFALVSHELRTPLTSITGYLELLQEDADEFDGDHQRFLAIIARNSKRLERLVGDLLFVAQLQAGKPAFDMHEVDLAAVVATAEDVARPRARAREVELDVHVEPGLTCRADGDRIGQVADHLLSNALKHTPQGGRVELRVRRGDDCTCIEVTDTGEGIAEADQLMVFEQFFRTDTATEQAIQGVGLGLTIVKAIVEGHGGHVSVTSAPGAGTTFTVSLPD